MMGYNMKSYAASNGILDLAYRGVAFEGIAINDTSDPATQINVALHTGTVTAGDAQTVNEANYTGYARLNIARNTGGWDAASLGQIANTALAQFPECTGGTNVVTWVSTGVGGVIFHAGALTDQRTISSGITPQFGPGDLVIRET
jgi:hypothetical protein